MAQAASPSPSHGHGHGHGVINKDTASTTVLRTRTADMRSECVRWVEAALQLASRRHAAERDVHTHSRRAVDAARDLYEPLKAVRQMEGDTRQLGQALLTRRAAIQQTVRATRDQLLNPVKRSQRWLQEAKRTLAAVDVDLAAVKQESARAMVHLEAEACEVEAELAGITAGVHAWAAEDAAAAGGCGASSAGTPARVRGRSAASGGAWATPTPGPRRGASGTPRRTASVPRAPVGSPSPNGLTPSPVDDVRAAPTIVSPPPATGGGRGRGTSRAGYSAIPAASPSPRLASGGSSGVAAASPTPGSGSPAGIGADASTAATPKEVLAYQRFMLHNGGATGGWSGEDHGVFMKLLQDATARGGGEEVLLSRLEVALEKERDVVYQHLTWYERERELREAKKQAIARWQENKQLDAMNARALASIEKRQAGPAEREVVRAQELREQAKRQQQAQDLRDWRAAKDAAAAQRAEEREAAQLAQRDLAKAKAAERERTRAAVAEYQEQKRLLADEKKRSTREAAKPATPRAAEAEVLLQLRARDSEIVRRKREGIIAKDKDRILSERRTRQHEQAATVKRTAERSFNRLTQPTIASHQRAHSVDAALREGSEPKPNGEGLLRGPQYTAPVPTRVSGRATVAWCGAGHLR